MIFDEITTKYLNKLIIEQFKRLQEEQYPSYFKSTHYREPNKQQIDEFERYPGMSVDTILWGINYNIVGKGIESKQSDNQIEGILKLLIHHYPDDDRYKQALKKYKQK